ncbi:hypothetical protein [Pedobacter sp. B4-66]|uniref:hypothetical protein n=1 Tax=Pedobacter sp. B4-66 TaxID=2817280 RepID=UPI001BDB4BC3|nr:hypothetical protein [Pedobacter sp. B4-66]
METTIEICPFTGRLAGYLDLPNGDKVCKHCGSWEPEQFLKYVDETIKNDDIDFRIELNDTRDKVYVNKEGINNAKEGAIKHYLVHLKKYCQDTGISVEDMDKKLHVAFTISKDKSYVFLQIFEQKLKNNML